MEKTVTNFCKNGQCSRCGECCMPFLPITNKEVKKIKKYIKENNIEKESQIDGNNIYITCCFYNRKEKKCNIYEVRPEVCRRFHCSDSKQQIEARKKFFDKRATINGSTGKFIGMDEIFYNDLTSLLYYIKHLNPQSIEEIISILRVMKRNDLIDGINKGQIKIEFSDEKE